MTLLETNPNYLPCEECTNWIEIVIRDEHNQPFPNIEGILVDAAGIAHPITAGEDPILLRTLAPGKVSIRFEDNAWINETQQRTPSDQGKTGFNLWLKDNPKGHQQSAWLNQTLTLGDFVSTKKSQQQPKRHQANALGKPSLVTNQSYYITIQGCRYITLRLGMFFDGTCNNTYSARWGKKQFEKHYLHWKAHYESSKAISKSQGQNIETIKPVDLPDECFKLPNSVSEDCISAINEITNIQKLFDLYQSGEFNEDKATYCHAEYITGIGTENSTEERPADEDSRGFAMGVGKYGVVEKVNAGIGQICSKLNMMILSAEQHTAVDGIKKLEFDVFGFSRGAAAARHFINVVLDGETGLFTSQFVNACQSHGFTLANNFDWGTNNNCQIMFAGLFDTVAAVATLSTGDLSVHDEDNDPVRLWLDPSRIKKAVHLVANNATEYRHNFSVNLLNPAPNFDEIIVPGAHSDIGGGYHSQLGFKHKDYLYPLLENKLIKTVSCYSSTSEVSQQSIQYLSRKLETIKNFEVAHGWDVDDYKILKPDIDNRGKKPKITQKLYYRKRTEGDLSRLYLRIMYGLAEYSKVPLNENKQNEICWHAELEPQSHNYPVPKQLTAKGSNETFPFEDYCEQALQYAKNGKVDKLRNKLGSEDLKNAFHSLNLIHHSSDENVTLGVIKPFKPNLINGSYARAEHACEQE